MLVTIKVLNGGEYPLEVSPDLKVQDLKSLLAKQINVHEDHQRLMLKGKPLQDTSTLKELSIEPGTKIHLSVRKDTESALNKHLKTVAKNYVADVDQFAIIFNKELKKLAMEMSLDDINRYDEAKETLKNKTQ